MPSDPKTEKKAERTFTPLKIATIYAIVGGPLILLSDQAMAILLGSSELVTRFQTFKGWFYILAAAFMIYLLIDRSMAAILRSEKKLRESEEKYRQLFATVPDAITLFDGETKQFIDVNEAAVCLYGYSKEELLELSLLDVTAEPESTKKAVERILSGKRTTIPLRYHKRKDGTVFPTEISTGTFTLENRRLVYGVVRDITERKQTEKALKLSEEKFSKAFNASPAWVAICTLEEGMYIDVNEAFLRGSGFHREEVIGRTGIEAGLWNNPDDRKKIVSKVLNEGSVRNIEIKYYTKSGQALDILFSGEKIEIGGKDYLLSISLDITERKKAEKERETLEAQLQRSQKMEAVGTLAGGIAHDFNNLLQAIQGYTELLLLGKKKDGTDYRELQEILTASQRGGELIQQILTFSRKVESKFKPVDLNSEVRHVLKILGRTIPKMIDIEFNLNEDLKKVNADPAQIEQVLMNLAVNAKDAMPGGGKLVIETKNVALDREYCIHHLEAFPGDYVLLSVSDTGRGMDTYTLEHIFEPFYTTKETGKGTGLGLAMVYGIIKNHGGNILCYSEPNAGTTFKIYLPVMEHEAEPKQTIEADLPKGGGETILLVDDEAFLRNLGRQILTKFGYTVLTVSDGEKALEMYGVEQNKIDLILLDLIMPGMGGRRCLEELLKMNPQAKVIIASGYSVNGLTKDVIDAGAKDFIRKPYELDQILKAICEVLDAD